MRLRVFTLLPILSILLSVLVASPARGWSNKEHMQLTRIAAMRLVADPSTPPAMKAWLTENTPGLADMKAEREYFMTARVGIVPRNVDGLPYWATMPDMAVYTDPQGNKIEPYGVHERLLHYVDLEYFHDDESRRVYRHDGRGKPELNDIPRDLTDPRYQRAGMLPFRVEESYRKLIEALRAGRLSDKLGQYPRDEHAARWAGYLAHYVQDNTQPHHATLDYKSQSYFADKRNAPNVHSVVEYRMADDENDDHMSLREAFWPLFEEALASVKDPVQADDLWRGTIEVAMTSYDALPLIGLAAMHAAGQGGTPDDPQGPAGVLDVEQFYQFRGAVGGRDTSVLEMKARQQAWAVKRLEKLWRKAWDEAARDRSAAVP